MGARKSRAIKKKKTITIEVTETSWENYCMWCSERFVSKRAAAKYCSARCRMAAHRARK